MLRPISSCPEDHSLLAGAAGAPAGQLFLAKTALTATGPAQALPPIQLP